MVPRYVVLAGDATFDPARLWSVRLWRLRADQARRHDPDRARDGVGRLVRRRQRDGLPDFAIGRLPVRTPTQAATVVGKITGYDAEPGGAWSKGVALVTDTDDPAVRFRASSADLETRVPSSYQLNRLDRDVLGVGPLRTNCSIWSTRASSSSTISATGRSTFGAIRASCWGPQTFPPTGRRPDRACRLSSP